MKKFQATARRANGFTLLEMVISLTVFILLAGAVFGIIYGVLNGTANLHDNQYHGDQVAALHGYLGNKLGDIPAAGMLVSYRRGTGDGLSQNGIILSSGEGITIIDATLQANGLYTLRSVYLSLDDLDVNHLHGPVSGLMPQIMNTMDSPSLQWMPLIKDVKTLHWKFEDFTTSLWADTWINGNNRPNLVEFSMQLAGDSPPTVMDFWLPQLTPATLVLPQTISPHAP